MRLSRSVRERIPADSQRSPRRAKRGQGLVEFAFCLPLMLLLVLGTLDFGQVFFEYIQMRSAVREGAVFAARYSSKGTEAAKTMVKESSGTDGILNDGNTTVTVTYSSDLATAHVGDSVTVTVWAERTFHPTILSFFSRIGLDTITMTASSDAKVWT